MSYDPACYDIAEKFLEGAFNTAANRNRLAQAVQDTIESELADIEREAMRREDDMDGFEPPTVRGEVV